MRLRQVISRNFGTFAHLPRKGIHPENFFGFFFTRIGSRGRVSNIPTVALLRMWVYLHVAVMWLHRLIKALIGIRSFKLLSCGHESEGFCLYGPGDFWKSSHYCLSFSRRTSTLKDPYHQRRHEPQDCAVEIWKFGITIGSDILCGISQGASVIRKERTRKSNYSWQNRERLYEVLS